MSFYFPVFNLPVCLRFSVAALPRRTYCSGQPSLGEDWPQLYTAAMRFPAMRVGRVTPCAPYRQAKAAVSRSTREAAPGAFFLPLSPRKWQDAAMNEGNGKPAGARPIVYAPIEFSTHNPPNLIVVERDKEAVLIRAAQNNFSPRRKAFLIRQLAAEGYIPDQFEEFMEYAPVKGLTWVVDRSLLFVGPAATKRTRRFMRRVIAGGYLLWFLEIALAFWRG
jgi:hypothetical protein